MLLEEIAGLKNEIEVSKAHYAQQLENRDEMIKKKDRIILKLEQEVERLKQNHAPNPDLIPLVPSTSHVDSIPPVNSMPYTGTIPKRKNNVCDPLPEHECKFLYNQFN